MNETSERNPHRKIVRNSIQTPDGTNLISRHRHDYNTYTDRNGFKYMVDGGNDYLRRALHVNNPYVETSLYSDDEHDILRKGVSWGRRDCGGRLSYIPINTMSRAHINNIIMDGYKGEIVNIMVRELEWRDVNEKASEGIRLEIQREESYG